MSGLGFGDFKRSSLYFPYEQNQSYKNIQIHNIGLPKKEGPFSHQMHKT